MFYGGLVPVHIHFIVYRHFYRNAGFVLNSPAFVFEVETFNFIFIFVCQLFFKEWPPPLRLES